MLKILVVWIFAIWVTGTAAQREAVEGHFCQIFKAVFQYLMNVYVFPMPQSHNGQLATAFSLIKGEGCQM